MTGAWVLAGPRDAIDRLRPLVRAHERLRPVRVHVAEDGARLGELLVGAAGLLLVGHRRRSPRTSLPGPFVPDADGRLVPVGWLPNIGAGLETFARAAARVAGRARERVGPIAVLGQWEPRYLHLATRMEKRLEACADRFSVLRWTAERVTRDDLVRGLRYGVGAAVYLGHGRPTGWAGYHGLRAEHLQRHVLQAVQQLVEEALGRAMALRRLWTRMSSRFPCWSTARQRGRTAWFKVGSFWVTPKVA